MLINIKVTTNSKKEGVEFNENLSLWCVKTNVLKIEGKANKKVIEILSEHFGVAKSLITIKKGQRSNLKLIEISKTI